VQQIGGNLISALLVPVAERFARSDFTLFSGVKLLESDIRGDVILLIILSLITLGYFSGFDAPLLRTNADQKESVLEE